MSHETKALDLLLLDAGCSEEFVDYAMNHRGSYRGDLKKFIDLIEHLMQNDADNSAHAGNNRSNTMDDGSRKVERDYTGDNLTSGGYEHIDQNRRW